MKKNTPIILFMFLFLGLIIIFFPQLKNISSQINFLSIFATKQPTLDSSEAFHLRQIITANSSNSRTIMWQSSLSQPDAFIEYRLKNSTNINTKSVSNEEFTDNKQTNYLHKITLTELQPASSYEYRIGWQKKLSPWYPLNTASQNNGNFKAIIFPDSQSSDYSIWQNVAQEAWASNPNADFFINMGDLVDNGEDHSQWRAWFNGVNGIINKIPFAPVLGNHETYDLNWQIRMPVAYLKLFSLPTNNSSVYQGQYYSYDYGDVHFVVLNTQLTEMDRFQPEMLAAQQAWLKNDLANSKQKWKVVLMHKDPLQYAIKNRPNRLAGISELGKIFMPIFDEFGVDVVLSAHLHTYRRRTPLKNFQPDLTGSLYILTGVAGNVRYQNFWEPHPLDAFVAPQPETNNYLTLERQEQKLIIKSFLPSGTQIDKIELAK